MKKILTSISLIGFVGLIAMAATGAFFSDTETSTGNTFEAGSLDLKIDNTSYYNGILNQSTTWELSDLPGHLFFNFSDLKPDDWGEDTISLHAENDSWSCMKITKTQNDDNTCTEPELVDDAECIAPGVGQGELNHEMSILFWADDGDNVLESDEVSKIFKQGDLETAFDGQLVTLADASKNLWSPSPAPLAGSKTYYIGKAWCFGEITAAALTQDGNGTESTRTPANSTGGVNCDGTLLNNASQTDVLKADVEFQAVQARHNPNFLCTPNGSPLPSPSTSPSPSPLACGKADVMMVLDRSGSISSTELGLLKTASKDFVDALGLTNLGVHAGFSSFATTGTLNQHLIDNGATVKTAIDALVSGGFTNLKEGIELATGELANPGDGHDRVEPGSPDKMLVITDGNPNRPDPSTAPAVGKAAADAARLAGSEIFVVGVGSDVNTAYLQTIADDAGHYFSVADYSALQTTLMSLDLCDE